MQNSNSLSESHFCAYTPHTAVVIHIREFFIKDIINTGKYTVFISPTLADGKIKCIYACKRLIRTAVS